MNSMNNMNMNMLLNMLSKMDKKDLEKGIEQANKILNSKDKDQIIDKLKNNNKDVSNLRDILLNFYYFHIVFIFKNFLFCDIFFSSYTFYIYYVITIVRIKYNKICLIF